MFQFMWNSMVCANRFIPGIAAGTRVKSVSYLPISLSTQFSIIIASMEYRVVERILGFFRGIIEAPSELLAQ